MEKGRDLFHGQIFCAACSYVVAFWSNDPVVEAKLKAPSGLCIILLLSAEALRN